MKIKSGVILFAFLVPAMVFAGCTKDEEEKNIPERPPAVSATEKTTPPPKSTAKPGKTPSPTENTKEIPISKTTGLAINKTAAERRPVAVVINNIEKALPQSGLGEADLIYEVLAEGDITRLVAIFQDFSAEKIGPVRSARRYFLDFAADQDAVFIHHGSSTQGYADIARRKTENIDGMIYEGVTFWRDAERVRQTGMYEHSSYTSAERILSQTGALGYRLAAKENDPGPFRFYDRFYVPPAGQAADTVKVPFSIRQDATFTYDPAQSVYRRFQFGQPHIDAETGEQLTVTNIIIQYADMYVLQNDAYGRREVELTAEGKGLLITAGKASPVTWRKEDENQPTAWFDAKGEKLAVNKGKTWICVTDAEKEVTIE